MAAAPKVNYGLLEADWRAGIKSAAQMAAEYTAATGVSVSRVAIGKHFDKLGIPREPRPRVHDRIVLSEAPAPSSRAGFLYVIYVDVSGERYFKIGISVGFSNRLEAHQCSSPFEVCVACAYFTPDMAQEEREIHTIFASKRVRGEWFRLDPDDVRTIASRAMLV